MTDKQIIIDDLKEMIYKLQIECAEKTDNILALGEQLKRKEQECEELKKKYELLLDNFLSNFYTGLDEKYDKLEQELQRKEQECKLLRETMRKDFCTHYVLGECSQKHHDNCVGRNQCIKDLEQECEKLEKQLESTKGLVTVGNKQLAEALLELQKYKDNEQQEKEIQKLYNKFEGNSLIEKRSPYGN